MKIAIIGANGKSGKLILKEANDRKYDTTAIIRNKNIKVPEAKNTIYKDLFELTKDDVKDYDVLVSAFAAWQEDKLNEHLTSIQHLTKILSGTNVRLIIVGGAGSLYMDKSHTTALIDTKDFPNEYKPLATAMGKGLDFLRTVNDVKWTYISPAAIFNADGAKTNEYILGGEEFFTNDKGESQISYADYAVALVDEITKGNHIKQRISVIGK